MSYLSLSLDIFQLATPTTINSISIKKSSTEYQLIDKNILVMDNEVLLFPSLKQ
jgi:hypothetical protein